MDNIPNAIDLLTCILYANGAKLLSSIEYSTPSFASNYYQAMNFEFTENHRPVDSTDICEVNFLPLSNNIEIERVNSFNFLWVTNLKQHNEITANKLSKYCHSFSKLKNYRISREHFTSVWSVPTELWISTMELQLKSLKTPKNIMRKICRNKQKAHAVNDPCIPKLFWYCQSRCA